MKKIADSQSESTIVLRYVHRAIYPDKLLKIYKEVSIVLQIFTNLEPHPDLAVRLHDIMNRLFYPPGF